jgi:hypothetical protein
MTTMRILAALLITAVAAPAFAQETQFESDVRREREDIAQSCSEVNVKALGGCAYTLATESPFHVALGSLAPQNGFAFGLGFDEHYTPNESWRITWNADAVATLSGSWRGGAYMKFVHTPATSGVVVRQPGAAPSSGAIAPREFAVVDVFAQTISLKTVNYFGPGQDSLESARSTFGEHQTIVGATATYPLSLQALSVLHPALIGGVSGRFVDIRTGSADDAPSIQQIYDDTTAPGLSQQRGFVELREGIRVKPALANGRVQLDYLLLAQQFRTSSDTRSSFSRWTLDLKHEIPLYHTVASSGPRNFNGPDSCAQAVGSSACPPVQWSRNREGSIGLRLLLSASATSGDNRIPFYFQPTLGGSDLNGDTMLASYQDYRFRGPDLLLLQESLEHSVWGPIGAYVLAEQGRVAAVGDLGFSDLSASTTVGLTLRAGGFPLVNLSFSWGGEGHHIIGSMDSTLLGGSSRPSLY